MATAANTKVRIEQQISQPVRHTIAVSRLLYTPPSFILRGPIWLIGIITFSAIAYACIATKDELVKSPLRLQREFTTIQSVGGGIVVDLPAQANTVVRYDELLVSVQEQTRMSGESEKEALQQKRSELEKELVKTQDEYDNEINKLKLTLQDYDTSTSAQKTSAEGRIQQIEEQLATAQRTLDRQQQQLATINTQFQRKKTLYESRDITVTEFEGAQEQVFGQQKAIDDTRSQIASIKVELATAKSEISKAEMLKSKEQLQADLDQMQTRRDRDVKAIEERLSILTSKLEEGKDLVEGVKFDENKTDYTSKFNGLITDVLVNKGQVIGAGQPLIAMVKETAPLEAIAIVENKDIGKLKKGQTVMFKYAAYPYQDYGIPEGIIIDIATKPSEQLGNKYPVRIALMSEDIQKHGERAKKLEIGLEGIAEIKTGQKRLIELVFRPLSKYFKDSERSESSAPATPASGS